MLKKVNKVVLASAITLSFVAGDVFAATEWNVSLWSKRRAFPSTLKNLLNWLPKKPMAISN